MSKSYRSQDLCIRRGEAEATASDMVIVCRSAKLGGHYSVMEGEVRPRELLGFHTHTNEDQHMYIIQGELHFEVGGKGGLRFTARAGDHVLKPRGSSHGFWNAGSETARYIETSTQDGFERFIDGRKDGFAAMVNSGASELGMSFETDRSLEVIKEFELTGLAGANVGGVEELLADPAFHRTMQTNESVRELLLYLGGAKIKELLKSKLPSLPKLG